MNIGKLMAALTAGLILAFAAFGTAEARADTMSFAGPKEAWAFINLKVAEAEKLLAAKNVEPIKEFGENFDAAINAMEAKSEMITGDGKTKLSSVLKQFDKAGDDLHDAAEGKNADASALALRKLKGLMPLIESLYPAGALK